MNLILCGFQGAGKTTRGRAFAKSVGVPFFDTDELLLQKRGGAVSCARIVAEEGEDAFRALECEVIASLEGITSSVIALGGGALDLKVNREKVLNLGCLVYLKIDYESAKSASRIQFSSFDALYRKRKEIFETLAAFWIGCDETLEKVWQEISLESTLRS